MTAGQVFQWFLTVLPLLRPCREKSSFPLNNYLKVNITLRGVCLAGIACSQVCHADLKQKKTVEGKESRASHLW